MTTTQIAYEAKTALPYDRAVESCREALAAEGFGVLTEIDIQATLKKKLDVDIGPYLILGACHPPSAHSVLTAAPEIGVLLPCNVTVSVEGGETVVRAMNPEGAMGMIGDPAVGEVAVEVGQRLQRVLAAIG
jgi:uncharacterized protein (DUF302 family)